MCVSYLEYESTSGASLMYSTHTKTITKGDSGTKEYPRAAQIALHNEIMRCNFTFGATFCGIDLPNIQIQIQIYFKCALCTLWGGRPVRGSGRPAA
jgi:hypothetical protein